MKVNPVRLAEFRKLDKAWLKLLSFYNAIETTDIHSANALTSNLQAFRSRFFAAIEIFPNIKCDLRSELREDLGTNIADRYCLIKIAINFVHGLNWALKRLNLHVIPSGAIWSERA